MSAIRLLSVGLVVLVSACSANPGAGGPQVGGEGFVGQVDVDNMTNVDLSITALVGNRQIPVGNVRSRQSRQIRLPPTVTGNYRLIAEPRGNVSMAARILSEPISASESRRVTWEIRSQQSAMIVYGRAGGVRP